VTSEIDPHVGLPSRDPLLRWAAQRPGDGSRAFVRGGAVAVAAPGLSVRDRLVVTGPASDAVPLVRDVLAEVGPTFRPLGPRSLLHTLTASLPGFRPVPPFGWMSIGRPPTDPPPHPAGVSVGWLGHDDHAEIRALLDAAFPASYACPGRRGARDRWAGVRVAGRLAAVAALAWCAPEVAFMAGVATSPHARGHGHARTVCGFLLREALASHPALGLIVDDANSPARRLYASLHLTYHPLSAASPPT